MSRVGLTIVGFTDVPFGSGPTNKPTDILKEDFARDRGESFDSTADYFSSNSSFSMAPPPGLRLTRSHSGCTDDSESLEEHFLHERRERSLSRLSVSSTASLSAEHDMSTAMGMPPLGLFDPRDVPPPGDIFNLSPSTPHDAGLDLASLVGPKPLLPDDSSIASSWSNSSLQFLLDDSLSQRPGDSTRQTYRDSFPAPPMGPPPGNFSPLVNPAGHSRSRLFTRNRGPTFPVESRDRRMSHFDSQVS